MNRFFFVLIGLLFFSSAAFAFFGLFERPSPMILINQTDINGDHVSVDFLNSFDINAGNITALSIDVNAVHANYFVARNFIDSNFLNDKTFWGVLLVLLDSLGLVVMLILVERFMVMVAI